MLAAIWKAGMVMPRTLNTSVPAMENANRMPAATQQASRAVRTRCSGMSFGVIARKAGTAASGSTITNSELSANKMYSSRSMEIELETVSAECQLT